MHTGPHLNVERLPHESEQCRTEVDGSVASDRHIHPDQFLQQQMRFSSSIKVRLVNPNHNPGQPVCDCACDKLSLFFVRQNINTQSDINATVNAQRNVYAKDV